MPKSKPHYKRKMKKRKDHQKLLKWAERKVDTMTPEEIAERWGFKKVEEEVSDDTAS